MQKQLLLSSQQEQNSQHYYPPVQSNSIAKMNISSYKQAYYRPAQVQPGCCFNSFEPRFDSMRNSYMNQGLFAKAKYLKIRRTYENKNWPTISQELEQKLPINMGPKFTSNYSNKIRYTWIGHSTAVINIDNRFNILIDPVFSQRCSPFSRLGPKRFRQAPCKISDLPKIDIVLISHDHFDHLDTRSLSQIEKLYKPYYVVGLNTSDVMPKSEKVRQLDWTKSICLKLDEQTFQITFVPVCHWGRRRLTDLNRRLWGGFVIKTPKGAQIFYSGDTGYCPIFKEIGQIFKTFDLAILPIGAYEPRQLLKFQHFNPQDSVICHKQIGSKKSVGVHWGTFSLGFEHWCQARQDLRIAAQKHGLKKEEFITVGHGNSFEIEHEWHKI